MATIVSPSFSTSALLVLGSTLLAKRVVNAVMANREHAAALELRRHEALIRDLYQSSGLSRRAD
jgi:hypothetical protein